MTSRTQLSAVLSALRFNSQNTRGLEALPETAWDALLGATDRVHLTLPLGIRCRDSLPDHVRSRIDRNLADNAAKYERLVLTQSQITDCLSSRGIEFAVMKGLSSWPYYTDNPHHRQQYDIDLYVPSASAPAALSAIQTLGYEPFSASPDPGTDHLPTMIRRTGWTWREDYYDPEMPPSVELHFRFWNPERVRFDVGDLERFWRRRVLRETGGVRFPALDPADGLSYSALHLVRHLLAGDVPLRHVYELAHFLHRSADDNSFWAEWRASGSMSYRTVEGIAFRLAGEWFDCRLNPHAQETVDQLPRSIQRWFELFARPTALLADASNKNELWLHWCLVKGSKDRREIALRRLFPVRRGRVVLDAHVPPAEAGLQLRAKRIIFEAGFVARRAVHHIRTLAPTIRGAWIWWRACTRTP
jgi:hypothetical protein